MRAARILERMRLSKSGWRPQDFEALYIGYGFEQRQGKAHTIYRHPRHAHLWATVSRSVPMSKAYAEDAVALIDELLRLEEAGDGSGAD